MSALTETQPSWFRQNYEKIVLVAVLLALLVSAAILVAQINTGRRLLKISGREISPADQKAAVPVKTESVQTALERMKTPFQSGQYTNRMFVSELRVACWKCGKPIPFDTVTCTFCGADQPIAPPPEQRDTDHDGMPDVYETAHGLNLYDPDDAQADADRDGFTNLEEFKAETNPEDADDYPPPIAKLRVKNVVTQPFKLRFLAVQELPGGQVRYQLNLRSLTRTYFAKIGETVEGYLVKAYDPDSRTLVLQRGDKVMRLEKGKTVNAQERLVRFFFLIDRSTIETRQGATFDLRGRTYRVTDVTPDGVAVEDVASGKQHLIGRLTPEEAAEMRAPSELPFGTEGVPEGVPPEMWRGMGRPGSRPGPAPR